MSTKNTHILKKFLTKIDYHYFLITLLAKFVIVCFFAEVKKILIKLIFVKIVVSFHKKMLIYIKVGGENE